MSLAIVHYNDPILRTKGEKISRFDQPLAELAGEMIATMHDAEGIGLAAQQIGRALQLCVVDLREVEIDFSWELDGARPPLGVIMPMVLVNPKVTLTPGIAASNYEEGCLSFPEIRGNVSRCESITVKFQDERGGAHTLVCDGLLARCIQHEVDHLNGILFIERMDAATRAALEPDIKALARATAAAKKK